MILNLPFSPEEVTINLTDARWVGAWWLGVLVCAFVNFLVAIPFCFLPKTLIKEGEENNIEVTAKRNTSLLQAENTGQAKIKLRELYKGEQNTKQKPKHIILKIPDNNKYTTVDQVSCF